MLCKNNPNFKFCLEVFPKDEGLNLEYKLLICKYRPELKICNKQQNDFPFIEGIINSKTFFSQKNKLKYYPTVGRENNKLFIDQSTHESLNNEEDKEGSVNHLTNYNTEYCNNIKGHIRIAKKLRLISKPFQIELGNNNTKIVSDKSIEVVLALYLEKISPNDINLPFLYNSIEISWVPNLKDSIVTQRYQPYIGNITFLNKNETEIIVYFSKVNHILESNYEVKINQILLNSCLNFINFHPPLRKLIKFNCHNFSPSLCEINNTKTNDNNILKTNCLSIGKWSAALHKHSNGQMNALVNLEYNLVDENDQTMKENFKYVAFIGYCDSKIDTYHKCQLNYDGLRRKTLCNPRKKKCTGLASIELNNFDFTKKKLAILVCIVMYEEFTDSWDYSNINLKRYKGDVINDNDDQKFHISDKESGKFVLGWQVIVAYGTVLILLFILLFWTIINKYRNINYKSEISIYNKNKLAFPSVIQRYYSSSTITINFEKPIAIGNTSIICKGYFGVQNKNDTTRKNVLENEKKFVAKIPKINITENELHEFFNEIIIYKHLDNNSKIVNFYGYTKLHDEKVLLLEYCSKLDLKSYLQLCRQHAYKLQKLGYDIEACDPSTIPKMNENLMITLKNALGIAVQVICGMEYLHTKEIIHCSLQANNIFLTDTFSVKIGDFGKSLYTGGVSKTHKTFMGLIDILDGENYRWLPLEAIKNSKFSYKTDIWSFGVLLQEILTLGGFPYHNTVFSKEGYQTFLEQNNCLPKSENAPNYIYKLQQSCWQLNKDDRPRINYLKKVFVNLYKSISASDYIQNYNFVPSKDISIYQNYLEKNSYIPMIDRENYIDTDHYLISNFYTNDNEIKHNFLFETERLLGYQALPHAST
ncbi:Tyrosine-protein kinase receptor torso [Strongyloides ratti]|uniref:Tyrosine-protein kinase receptor torso n=1 Tax=Strongyloides ratti TaxID=34506 RepID=A0A090MW19_STRRB|nr:Tyrosine-protein kinase receptor torso [Strongyloides ratti]CEF63323.1 Tyrosine-protein kinase receptor torso [Strongyloides ratti]